MVLPFVLPGGGTLSAAGHHHAHVAATHGIMAGTNAIAVAIHTLAYLVVMTLVAWFVYRRLGLSLLRKAWLNVDWVWAIALVVTGVVVMLT
jgi:hypothetical protein